MNHSRANSAVALLQAFENKIANEIFDTIKPPCLPPPQQQPPLVLTTSDLAADFEVAALSVPWGAPASELFPTPPPADLVDACHSPLERPRAPAPPPDVLSLAPAAALGELVCEATPTAPVALLAPPPRARSKLSASAPPVIPDQTAPVVSKGLQHRSNEAMNATSSRWADDEPGSEPAVPERRSARSTSRRSRQGQSEPRPANLAAGLVAPEPVEVVSTSLPRRAALAGGDDLMRGFDEACGEGGDNGEQAGSIVVADPLDLAEFACLELPSPSRASFHINESAGHNQPERLETSSKPVDEEHHQGVGCFVVTGDGKHANSTICADVVSVAVADCAIRPHRTRSGKVPDEAPPPPPPRTRPRPPPKPLPPPKPPPAADDSLAQPTGEDEASASNAGTSKSAEPKDEDDDDEKDKQEEVNKPIASTNNPSGYKGVYPARNGRWQAQVLHRAIGGFPTAWEAGVAVARAIYAHKLEKQKARLKKNNKKNNKKKNKKQRSS